MADTSATGIDPEILTIPPEVRDLGLQATWEIAALLQHIITLCPMVDDDQTPLVVRGMAQRATALNSVLMSMLDNDLLNGHPSLKGLTRKVLGDEAADDEDSEP